MWSKLRKATNTVFLQSDAAATIYFGACFVWLIFILLLVGCYYSRAAFISFKSFGLCGYYLRVATIRGWRLFEEILYVIKVDLQISWFCCKCFFYKPRLRDYPLCVLPQEHITACEVTLLVHQRISWCQHAFDQWLPPHGYWKPFFLSILSQGQGLVVSCPDPTRKVWWHSADSSGFTDDS